MARYHLNPTTGEPGLCRATVECPFGDVHTEHYDTRARAREAYELKQAGDFIPASLSRSSSPRYQSPADFDAPYLAEEARKRIATLTHEQIVGEARQIMDRLESDLGNEATAEEEEYLKAWDRVSEGLPPLEGKPSFWGRVKARVAGPEAKERLATMLMVMEQNTGPARLNPSSVGHRATEEELSQARFL